MKTGVHCWRRHPTPVRGPALTWAGCLHRGCQEGWARDSCFRKAFASFCTKLSLLEPDSYRGQVGRVYPRKEKNPPVSAWAQGGLLKCWTEPPREGGDHQQERDRGARRDSEGIASDHVPTHVLATLSLLQRFWGTMCSWAR